MKLCAVSDSLGHLSFEDVTKAAAELGLAALQIRVGNWSGAPHADLQSLLKSKEKPRDFFSVLERNGLSLAALNCNGNQPHPVDGERQSKVVYDSSGTKTYPVCPGKSNRIRSELLSRAEPNNAVEASLPALGVSRRSPYSAPAIPVGGRLAEQATTRLPE